jgi:hypothetical protein
MMPPILAKLTAFVGRRGRGRVERRAFRRLTPGHLTPCEVRIPGVGEPRPAWVHNLSLRGVGILTEQEYRPGMRVGLLLVNAGHTFALSTEMEVVRCFRVVNGDYFVGGHFIRQLRHDELLPFMM